MYSSRFLYVCKFFLCSCDVFLPVILLLFLCGAFLHGGLTPIQPVSLQFYSSGHTMPYVNSNNIVTMQHQNDRLSMIMLKVQRKMVTWG